MIKVVFEANLLGRLVGLLLEDKGVFVVTVPLDLIHCLDLPVDLELVRFVMRLDVLLFLLTIIDSRFHLVLRWRDERIHLTEVLPSV